MKFCFHSDAGNHTLKVIENLYHHLYKSRRTKFETLLHFRNLKDHNLYTYKHLQINKKDALLELVNQEYSPVISTKKLHLIWAITETKIIEKTIPYLNQLGVKKITLFFANRSQKNEIVSLERIQKILIASCEQCNRSDLMIVEILKSTEEAIKRYPLSFVLDFDGDNIYTSKIRDFENGIFIGPEGGFDPQEKKLFEKQQKLCIPNQIVLKSECASIFISSLATI